MATTASLRDAATALRLLAETVEKRIGDDPLRPGEPVVYGRSGLANDLATMRDLIERIEAATK